MQNANHPRPPRRGPPPPPAGKKFQRTDAPSGSEAWRAPWVQHKYFSYHPTIYPAMIRAVSPDAKAGDLVSVYDKDGAPFGAGLYNPNARVPLRMYYHGPDAASEDCFLQLIERAAELRLRLPELNDGGGTDSFRIIHSDGDGLSGLVVDKYADTLSVEANSLGVYQRLPQWLPILHEKFGTRRQVVHVDERIARMEGIRASRPAEAPPKSVKIREHGLRYEVDFESGHKTGFFCDQRENRRKFSTLVKDARVLDLCCYTGGFALAAALGGAKEITGVDLDEKAIAMAKRNANLNQLRIDWAHCDAFSYARQMQRNQDLWDAVVLDPPKFLDSREGYPEAEQKYHDLNALGLMLVKPGGLLVTCSCSGLLAIEQFEEILVRAAHRRGRRLQYLDRTGAGADHPIMSNCPESRYLKVIWARIV